MPADLRLIEDLKIHLTTMNKIDNITISKVIEDAKFSESEDYVLEFQVPPNIGQVDVRVECKVHVASKNEKVNFSQSNTFKVNNHSDDYLFAEAFLRKVGNDYYYLIKGKNGEPKANVVCKFNFTHKMYTGNIQTVELKSNSEGAIVLGPLKHISNFTATLRESRVVGEIMHSYELPS